jgi:hypothetical protein
LRQLALRRKLAIAGRDADSPDRPVCRLLAVAAAWRPVRDGDPAASTEAERGAPPSGSGGTMLGLSLDRPMCARLAPASCPDCAATISTLALRRAAAGPRAEAPTYPDDTPPAAADADGDADAEADANEPAPSAEGPRLRADITALPDAVATLKAGDAEAAM